MKTPNPEQKSAPEILSPAKEDIKVPFLDIVRTFYGLSGEEHRLTEDDAPEKEKKGGSYGEVRQQEQDDTKEETEVHHIPADSVSPLERNDGPAIRMEKSDHKKTASCGSSSDAKAYREEQKRLIEVGKFDEAVQMDIDDIHEKFGDKYDDAIAEMLDYIAELKEEGKIDA